MSFKKFSALYEHYKEFHNFKTQRMLYKIERENNDDEWLKD